MQFVHATASSALTPTGGFLGGGGGADGGFTHSFNPAAGCAFARGLCGEFCYARGFAERMLGAGTWGRVVSLKRNAPELLEHELERASRRAPEHRHHVTRLRVFSASSTDPCAGPALALYRRCLEVVARYPIGRWVLQTRSPGVLELEDEILALGERVALSFSVETDDEELWSAGPPGAPSIAARRRAFERLATWPVRRCLAVSPCLPLRAPEAFADWIAARATDAVVDTFPSGDGASGRRTARTGLPARLAARGHDWRDERQARALLELLRGRMGERAAWSEAGFRRLASSA